MSTAVGEESVSIEATNGALLIGTVAIIVAIAAVRLSLRLGLPGLLVYLALGLVLGEAGLGIEFENAELAQNLGLGALALILAEGGLTTRWRDIRASIPVAISLATVGIAVTVGAVAAAGHWLLGLDWQLALLLGAVLAPTDAAAVFSVLRRLPLSPRLSGLLEAESGFNDAPSVILVLLFTSGAMSDPFGFGVTVVYELAVGAAVGLAIGPAGAYALRRVALPASGLYPIAALALALMAYASAGLLHASGFMAVYVAALVLGNSRLPHGAATRGFAESVAWLAQIGLFLMLGLLVSPAALPAELVAALVGAALLVLVARPLAVLLSVTPYEIVLRVVEGRWRGANGDEPTGGPGGPGEAGRLRRAGPLWGTGSEGRTERTEHSTRGGGGERRDGRDRTERARGVRRGDRTERGGRAGWLERGARAARAGRVRLGGRVRRAGRGRRGGSLLPGRRTGSWWREQVFVSWAGLRGAVPIVLATVPVSAEVPGADRLFAQVFIIVVVCTLIQGPTLPAFTRWCRVAAPAEAVDLDVEAAPLEVIAADLLEVKIPPESKLHGVEIFELRLPAEAAITLIVRDGRSFVPDPSTVLRAGDELLVVAGQGAREATERRLRAVSRAGRLATWLGERGDEYA